MLIAIDWGTSSLRAARLDDEGRATEERELPRGILTVPAGGFRQVFEEACGDWMKAPGAVAFICGMAGSQQGWKEAPYAPCPAGFAELASRITWIEPGRIAVVPGITCDIAGVPDVIRGEETKALGAARMLGLADAQVVMPGTHCKWATLRSGGVESFATYMTGEFYALLRRHSILARTMPADDAELDGPVFLRGIDHAIETGNLLHAAFSARTLALFDRIPMNARASYLSGLLIGEEMRSRPAGGPVVLIGAQALNARYALALQHLGVQFQALGQEATWLGLHFIARSS